MSYATSPTQALPHAGVPKPLQRVLPLLGLAAFAAAMIGFGWVGYLESDDLFYAQAAQAWAENGTHLGQSHWSLRHIIVLPMAALFRLFGRSEWTLVAPMLAYTAALLALTFLCLRAVAGVAPALLAAGLVASTPLIASGASMVFSDLPEAVMVLASLWCFHFACERAAAARPSRALFVLAGALAGLGFVTRETTVALLAVYAVLFMAGYGRDRLAYVWMGGGFLLVVGLDAALLGWVSGDPLHRFHVSLRGVAGDNPSMVERFRTEGLFDRHGVIVAPRWVQAPLMMLANQTIGPLPWLAIPAACILAWRPADSERRRVARLFGLLALLWFVVLSYGLSSLWLVPRYQTVAVCALAIPLGIWLAELAGQGRRLLVGLLATGLLAANLLMLAATDRQPLLAERVLVDSAMHAGEVVRTDPVTFAGAAWMLDAVQAREQASAGPPVPGGLYLFNPRPRRRLPTDWSWRAPSPDWTPVARTVEGPRPAARLLAALSLDRILPGPLREKLNGPPRVVTLYRIPAAAGAER